MNKRFDALSKRIATLAGRPVTFILALGIVLIWAALGPLFGWSDTHQLVINTSTTIITFLLVFVIQNTQNRDNLALHTKIDALIDDLTERYDLEGLEDKPEREIERSRKK